MNLPKKPFAWLCVLGILVLGLSFLAACQPAEPEVTPTVEPTEPPTQEPTPEPVDQSMYLAAWETGVHGDTYDLGKGPNDYCSRCHSPLNWNPESKVSAAPTCVTCKFATDAELRISPTMNFVDEVDWKGITCVNCHEVDENGVASETIAWLNPITMEYEPIASSNELCGKCHANTSGVKFTGGRGVTHAIDLGGSAHLEYAGAWPQSDRPDSCSDCHDPHSGAAKQCVECHTDIEASTTHMGGLNSVMLAKVSCMACHDASGMDVGPHPDEAMGGVFTTILTSTSRSGATTTSYVHSHSIQWTVSCDRCHFEGNTWELTVRDATGAVPTPNP